MVKKKIDSKPARASKKASGKKTSTKTAKKTSTKKSSSDDAKASATKKKTAEKRATKTPSAKKTSTTKPAAKKAAAAPPKRKTNKFIRRWIELPQDELEALFESTPAPEILDAFEASYASDVVNLLLDLRKSVVLALLERLSAARKRALGEIVTLYYYKAYMMDPLPLQVGRDSTPNYYAILGIPRESDAEDIKTAHRLLSRAHSPDGFSPAMRAAAEERLGEIKDAFHHLSTADRRLETDRILPTMNYLYPRRDQSWLESAQRVLQS